MAQTVLLDMVAELGGRLENQPVCRKQHKEHKVYPTSSITVMQLVAIGM